MGFFEDELRKLFGANSPIADARFGGRACVGRLGETTNVKLQFVTLGTYEKYEGIKATVYNRKDGEIDSSTFRFADILGKNVRKNNLNRDLPYVWKNSNVGHEWYSYKPTAADYAAVANEVNGYLELFLEQQRSPERPGRSKSVNLYLLYSCNEWCEKSKASLLLVTSDKETLYAAIGGEILTGGMEYDGESGGKGFAEYKWDYLNHNVMMGKLQYGFIVEMDEALLSEPETVSKYYTDASDFLDVYFDFDSDAFDKAYNSEDIEHDGENELDEEQDGEDMEI